MVEPVRNKTVDHACVWIAVAGENPLLAGCPSVLPAWQDRGHSRLRPALYF